MRYEKSHKFEKLIKMTQNKQNLGIMFCTNM